MLFRSAMISLSRFLYRKPRTHVLGQVGTGWLGLLISWVMLGGGVTLAVVSLAGFFSVEQGVCVGYDESVCQIASIGGSITGVAAMAGAVLWSITIARGFGPPAAWWAAPGAVGGLGVMVFLDAVAGTGEVALGAVAASLVLILIALVLVVLMLPQLDRALAGWTRLDGLSVDEVRMRGVDQVVLPAAAIAAAFAGGAFALHMFGQLTTN